MCAIEAAADIGKPEISDQPLSDPIALERSQSCIFRRQFRSVKKREASNLQCISLVAREIELRVQLSRKDHCDVLAAAVCTEVIRSQSQRSLICAGAGRPCRKAEHERHRELGIQIRPMR